MWASSRLLYTEHKLFYFYFQVGAVIVGLDQHINFYKLQYVSYKALLFYELEL